MRDQGIAEEIKQCSVTVNLNSTYKCTEYLKWKAPCTLAIMLYLQTVIAGRCQKKASDS